MDRQKAPVIRHKEIPNAYFLLPSAYRERRGFTLLLAALVASITLALGVSIFEIAQKEVILSSLGKDSQFAFYTADTGAECALYWDVRSDKHPNTFATSTDSYLLLPVYPAASILCGGETAEVTSNDPSTPSTPTFAASTFNVNFTSVFRPNGLCAEVTVKKCGGTFEANGTCTAAPPKLQTIIHADGYNTKCTEIATNPRSLQRSVEIRY